MAEWAQEIKLNTDSQHKAPYGSGITVGGAFCVRNAWALNAFSFLGYIIPDILIFVKSGAVIPRSNRDSVA